MAFNPTILRFKPDPKKQEQQAQEAGSIHETVLGRLTGLSKQARYKQKVRRREHKATDQAIHEKREHFLTWDKEHVKMNPDKRLLMQEQARLNRKYGPHRRERAQEKFEEFKEHRLRDEIRRLRKERDERIWQEGQRLTAMAKGEMQDRGEKPRFLSHLTSWPAKTSGPRQRGQARRAA